MDINLQYADAHMFPYIFSLLYEDGSPVGSIPSELWSADALEKAGFAPMFHQHRAMINRLGSATAYDPSFHNFLFSRLLANITSKKKHTGIVKYGLEAAFPGGISGQRYQSWYGNLDVTDPNIERSTTSSRVAFLQSAVKRFTNWAFFLSVSLNMAHTVGFEVYRILATRQAAHEPSLQLLCAQVAPIDQRTCVLASAWT